MREDSATVFPYLMAKCHKECTCSCRRVVTFLTVQVGFIPHKQACHNGSNSMWSVIFCIFPTTSGVIVFDKIFEDRGEEIVMLLKCSFKREINQFIDQRTCKISTVSRIGNKVGQGFKEWYFGVICGLSRENICIFFGNIGHGIVENGIKVAFALLIPKVGNKMIWLKNRYVGTQRTL